MNVMDDLCARPLRSSFGLRIVLLIALFALMMASRNPALAKKAPTFTPGSLSTCDGTGLNGLSFGKSTAQSVKDSMNVNKHNDIPRSLRLVTPRSSGLVVHALFAGKTDAGPLTGVILDYTPGKPYLSSVQQDIGSEGVSYYPQTRYEDWWIQVFAKQGLIAYVTNPGVPHVEAIFVCPPTALNDSLDGYSTDKSTISTVVSDNSTAANPIQFGTVKVDADTTGMDIIADTQQAIESDMKSDTAGGTIRYWTGGPGSYTVKLTGTYAPDKGGTIAADATISGPGPGGTISGEASGSKDIPANTSDFARYARDAAQDARKGAEARFNDNLRNSNPPTLETFRTRAWNDLVSRLRFTSDAAVLNPK